MARDIDRTTSHMCEGLARDEAYLAARGTPMYVCSCGAAIDERYAQFALICAFCRRECLDHTDVREAFCLWCNASLG